MPVKERAQTRGLNFRIGTNEDGTWPNDAIMCVVLMDIRDELHKLNALLGCQNFIGIPTTLRSIRRAMPRRRKASK